MRHDGRPSDQIRPLEIRRHFTRSAAGSVYIRAGRTTILCTASVEESVPPWKMSDDPTTVSGWVTAEYNMLPGSTSPRKRRDRTKVDGRTTEIQRLIGRSLRAVVDFEALGPRTITIDCDVLEADGGTRTLSISGGFVALVDAVNTLGLGAAVIKDSVAAISVGLVQNQLLLDLDYSEDVSADVDMNIVMTGSGEFIEVQGTAEGSPFSPQVLQQQLLLAQQGIEQVTEQQRAALDVDWPFANSEK